MCMYHYVCRTCFDFSSDDLPNASWKIWRRIRNSSNRHGQYPNWSTFAGFSCLPFNRGNLELHCHQIIAAYWHLGLSWSYEFFLFSPLLCSSGILSWQLYQQCQRRRRICTTITRCYQRRSVVSHWQQQPIWVDGKLNCFYYPLQL